MSTSLSPKFKNCGIFTQNFNLTAKVQTLYYSLQLLCVFIIKKIGNFFLKYFVDRVS
jgi:hypothetical protein